jgi:hypothetical protein
MSGKFREILAISLIALAAAFPPRAASAPDHKPSPHYSIKKLKVLREGKYRAIVTGVLCNACTRAIVLRLKRIKGIESAAFDFEEGFLWITVAKDREVRTGKVLRAMRLAGRQVDLGTRFQIAEIRNVN